MELIIQKSVELGASEIFPFYSSRSIPRLDKEKAKKKKDRWREIAIQSCKQSNRVYVPVIKEVSAYEDFLKYSSKYDALRIILWENGERKLKEILRNNDKYNIILAIGPEGGFSDKEVDLAIKYEFIPIGLGDKILRTETVSLSIMSIIQYEIGDIG
jgi:16S rRNA (uracil1498-N3)-methyltransferase